MLVLKRVGIILITIILIVFVALQVTLGSDVMYNSIFNLFAANYRNEIELSKQFFSLLQSGDFVSLEKFDPSLSGDHSVRERDNLEKLAALFPGVKPTDVKLIGVQHNTSFGNRETFSETSVGFEYEFPGKSVYARVVLREQQNSISVKKITVVPLQDSLESINKFTFSGKPVGNLIFLSAIMMVLAFIVWRLIICVKTPIPKRKWLWVLFVSLGFLSINLNWTDVDINIVPLSIQFMGASFWRAGPFSPVILSVSVPLGAIIFFFRRTTAKGGSLTPIE
jgi:hypothetical protein